MQPAPGTTEVIAYRNPMEQWYWHHLGEVWGFVLLVALAIYVVFLPVLVFYFRRPSVYESNAWGQAVLLTLFWPVTLPASLAR